MSKQCFFPDGSTAPDDRPCNSLAAESTCCGPGSICMDNNLCFTSNGTAGGNTMSRSSCTDQSWNSGSCFQRCKDIAPAGGIPLYLVASPMSQNYTFCCGPFNNTANACQNQNDGTAVPFQIPNGNAIYNWTDGSTKVLNTQAASLSPPGATVTQSQIATATQTVHANDPSRDAAIGAGVGVPLGVLLLCALAALLLQIRHRQRIERMYKQSQQALELMHQPGSQSDAKQELLGTPLAELGSGTK